MVIKYLIPGIFVSVNRMNTTCFTLLLHRYSDSAEEKKTKIFRTRKTLFGQSFVSGCCGQKSFASLVFCSVFVETFFDKVVLRCKSSS